MSPLAKIFVIVNFILSVAFFGSSATLFTTRVNWKQKFEQFNKESLEELKRINAKYAEQGGRLADLSKQHVKLNTDYNSTMTEKTKLEGTISELKTKLSSEELRIESEVKEKQALTARLQALEKNNTDLVSKVEALSKEAEEARVEKENAITNMTRWRVDLDKVNEELMKTQIAYHELGQKAETLQHQVKAAVDAGFDIALAASAPPIDGIVEMVKAEEKLVVLSVGRDQKVQEGFEFTIYRGDRFIGKVKVTKVYDNLAGAKILFLSENEMIQAGDKAATQI